MASHRTIWKSLAAAGLLVGATGSLMAWRLSRVTPVEPDTASTTLYDFTVPDLDGRASPLSAYRGRVALVVNVASECGLAGQYPELEALYRHHRDRGFVVLAFPSDDFWQEPRSEGEIRTMCDARGVTYPVFGKTHVRGPSRSPMYGFLASTGGAPLWNFAKYLVGRDGRSRGFFGSLVAPDSPVLTRAIERALAEPAPTAEHARPQ